MASQNNLSESRLKTAFSSRNWIDLRSHLESVVLDEFSFDELLGHLRRFSGFILRYPDPKREQRRDEFLSDLREYVHERLGINASGRVSAEIKLLLQVERGYRSILSALDSADISKLAPPTRVSACLNWALLAYEKVTERSRATINRSHDYALQSSPTILDDDGQPIPIDTAIDAIVKALSTTLIMEAHRNKWQDSDGTVLLPPLPPVDDDAVLKAVGNADLAMCWSRWQRIEERRRFLGGDLREYLPPNLPSWAPSEATAATEYSLNEDEFFDFAANERFLERLGQQLFELLVETDLQKKVSGITNSVALLPIGFVSVAEAHAASGLGDILKYEITDDLDRPGGLRIVEWLRGYAVLQELAKTALAAEPNVSGLVSVVTRIELMSSLTRCGLAEVTAERFIDSVTLKVSSEDLFDSPLIKFVSTQLLLFGPALLTANLCSIVLSMLGTLGESFPRKGFALEAMVLSLLTQRNLQARGFKVTRNGEEYEYDAVLVWDEYVFVFECKNRSLSRNRPVDAYYFQLGIRSAAQQTKRLVDALYRYPDILANEMQADVATKKVVPIVLNSLPYSRIGEIDGVYCIDSSVLDRFFSDRYVFVKIPHRIRENSTIMHRVALSSLWSKQAPSPKDLLEQVKEPAQLKILKHHTQQLSTIFQIGSAHFVSTVEYMKTAWSIESMCRVFGLDPRSVRKEIDAVRQTARQLRKKVRRKGKRTRKK